MGRMAERLRLRGQNPQNGGKDWFDPLGSNSPEDEFIRSLGGGSTLDWEILRQSNQKIPTADLVGVENLGFIAAEKEIVNRMTAITSGTRKERESAEKYLINRAAHGTADDLFDVINSALVSLLLIMRKPQELGILNDVGVQPQRTTEALRNARNFISDLIHRLWHDSRRYEINTGRQSTRSKLRVANGAFDLLDVDSEWRRNTNFGFELGNLSAFFSRRELVKHISFYPNLNDKEIDELNKATQIKISELTQRQFDLATRAIFNIKLPFSVRDELDVKQSFEQDKEGVRKPASLILTRVFSMLEEHELTQTIQFITNSLKSTNPSVRNCVYRLLSHLDYLEESVGEFGSLHSAVAKWSIQLQTYLGRMADGDESVNNELKSEIENMLNTVVSLPSVELPFIIWSFLVSNADAGNVQSLLNRELMHKLIDSEIQNQALDLYCRTFRDAITEHIPKDEFFEIFDERRSLGYFFDNLRVRWQDLRRITLNEMWPSFITARQVKIWPSEKEIDILEFSRRHPAEVLGFSNIRFFTRGYEPPEVGLEFAFKQTGKVLPGSLDRNGRLVSLPFDIEESHPHIHTFLEHIAVGSFQELVTVAEKRIKESGQGSRTRAVPQGEHTGETSSHLTSIPRRETTYVTITGHYQPQVTQSDEVIEKASERERLPKLIPQKVVPLAYSQRYRYLTGLLQAARKRNAPENELRDLEGEVLFTLSLIPKPSSGKLENLPEQFQLEQTMDGKFMETWRVEHLRPKSKAGEEPTLPEIFERRFRAAPIALTKHLETWFTQPPKTS